MTKMLICGSAAVAALLCPAEIPDAPGLETPLVQTRWSAAPDVRDRNFWDELRQRPEAETLLQEAETLLSQSFAEPEDALYLEYSVTGNRSNYQQYYSRLSGAATRTAYAYLLTRDPRFLQKLEQVLGVFIRMKSWSLPAHDMGNQCFEGRGMIVELGSSLLSWELAVIHHLVGPDLSPEVAEALKTELYRRTIVPVEDAFAGRRPEYWWMRGANNWNAVCLTGIVGTVLALEQDNQRKTALVDLCLRFSSYSLKAFPADGYCSEGVSYWNYGFGHNLRLALLIYGATAGRQNLLKLPAMQPPLLYPGKIRMAPGLCPAFADCAFGSDIGREYLDYIDFLQGYRPDSGTPALLGDNLALLLLRGYAGRGIARELADKPQMEAWPAESLFEQAGVAILRPGHSGSRLHAAIKGGSNHELHNHNDVGSYTIAVDGVPVLVDPGSEVYTKRTFSRKRYLGQTLNSFGHPVPRIDGKLQIPGDATDAELLRQERTPELFHWQLEYRHAYGNPELESLIRDFKFRREGEGSVTVTDTWRATRPVTFETALISFGDFEILDDHTVRVTEMGKSLTVTVTAPEFVFEEVLINEDLPGKRCPKRLAIRLKQPFATASVTLDIQP